MNKQIIFAIVLLGLLAPSLTASAAYDRGDRGRDRDRNWNQSNGWDRHEERGSPRRSEVRHVPRREYVPMFRPERARYLRRQNIFYQDGYFYQFYYGRYVMVAPPVGAVVPALPYGTVTYVQNGVPYYYYAGTSYVPTPAGFTVAAPCPL